MNSKQIKPKQFHWDFLIKNYDDPLFVVNNNSHSYGIRTKSGTNSLEFALMLKLIGVTEVAENFLEMHLNAKLLFHERLKFPIRIVTSNF